MLDEPVVLVGHPAPAPIVYGAADQRIDRIARIVYVDTWPLPEGTPNNDELPVVDGTVPLPDWSVFDDADLRDLDEVARIRFRDRAVAEPAGTARDEQRSTTNGAAASPHRHRELALGGRYREWFASPFFAELVALENVDFVDLPTAHWPQFTRPRELGDAIVSAIAWRGRHA